MRRLTGLVAAALMAFAACGGKKEEQAPKTNLGEQLKKVKALHAQHVEKVQALSKLRSELAQIKVKARSNPAEAQRQAEVEAQVKTASKELDKVFADDQNELTSFLNTALNESPQAPETIEGLKIYAEDTILNAKDFMNEAGDYRKATELLETAQSYFESVNAPVPSELTSLLEHARKFRFITKERYDKVQKGMTQEEVKEITGTPLTLNVREQEVKGKKVTVWLFRSEAGDVASFFFDDKGKLYSKDWKTAS